MILLYPNIRVLNSLFTEIRTERKLVLVLKQDRKRKEEFKMGNRPIKKFKSGSIEAAVWLNEREVDGNIVGFKTVSLRRSWRDREKDIWRDETVNLRKGDISKALLVLQKAQEEVLLNQEDKEGEDNE